MNNLFKSAQTDNVPRNKLDVILLNALWIGKRLASFGIFFFIYPFLDLKFTTFQKISLAVSAAGVVIACVSAIAHIYLGKRKL